MTHEEMIQKFIAYTRISVQAATEHLEFFNWDYERAVDWYWRNIILCCDIDCDT